MLPPGAFDFIAAGQKIEALRKGGMTDADIAAACGLTSFKVTCLSRRMALVSLAEIEALLAL